MTQEGGREDADVHGPWKVLDQARADGADQRSSWEGSSISSSSLQMTEVICAWRRMWWSRTLSALSGSG